MTQSRDWSAVPLVILLLSFLAGCAMSPTKQKLATLDYGACPRNYEAKIKEHFQSGLLFAYSGEPIIWPPQKFWYKSPPLGGGKLNTGYLVIVMVDQTGGRFQSRGKRLYGFLFRGDKIVKKWNPMEMDRLPTSEGVRPMPKDERDWKEGYSKETAVRVLKEYVLPGETVHNWSELITFIIFRNVSLDTTPQKLVTGAEIQKKRCANVSKKVLASSQTELLFEQTLVNCAPMPNEYSIRKLIRGPRTIIEVSYSKKTVMKDAEKKKWTKIIGRAKFPNDCQLKP